MVGRERASAAPSTWELDVQGESAAVTRTSSRAHDGGLPVELVIARGTSAAVDGWIPLKIVEFLGDPRKRHCSANDVQTISAMLRSEKYIEAIIKRLGLENFHLKTRNNKHDSDYAPRRQARSKS